MKKLLLVLVPLAVFAQVEIDTVIRLPTSNLGKGFFIPELNKLYVLGDSQFFVLDCSTYQLKAQIPFPWGVHLIHYSWNWRRQKLYIGINPHPDSTLVIDASADTVIGWLVVSREDHYDTYVSDLDYLYKSVSDTLYAFDCAADTVVRRILAPLPPRSISYTSWDSTGRRLYVGLGGKLLGVYNYVADSFVKVIDASSVLGVQPNVLVFNHSHRKAYLAPYQPEPWEANVGIIDTEHDTLLGVLPVQIWRGLYSQVAVDERDGKVYLADNDADPETPDTLWVVDCATDSVLKKVEYEQQGFGTISMRWVPWSNRIYLSCDVFDSSFIAVLDCNTDSIIVPGLQLGNDVAVDIQLDPIRERIFVIRAEGNTVHVLRDVGYGVAEPPASSPRPAPRASLRESPAGIELEYHVESQGRVQVSVYDLLGRDVKTLVAENQTAGLHRVFWKRTDSRGARVSRGIYYFSVTVGATRASIKAVVR